MIWLKILRNIPYGTFKLRFVEYIVKEFKFKAAEYSSKFAQDILYNIARQKPNWSAHPGRSRKFGKPEPG